MSSPVQITDGTRFASIDRHNNTLAITAYEHSEIHAGAAHRADAQAVDLANAATLSIDFKTPASGKLMHFIVAASTENAADIIFYEDIELSGNGSAITPRNANRNFGDGGTVQFMFKDSTLVTTNTVVLGSRHIGSTGSRPSDPSIGGGQVVSRHEWVLRADTWYSVLLTNVSGGVQTVWIGLDWYEHTPKTS